MITKKIITASVLLTLTACASKGRRGADPAINTEAAAPVLEPEVVAKAEILADKVIPEDQLAKANTDISNKMPFIVVPIAKNNLWERITGNGNGYCVLVPGYDKTVQGDGMLYPLKDKAYSQVQVQSAFNYWPQGFQTVLSYGAVGAGFLAWVFRAPQASERQQLLRPGSINLALFFSVSTAGMIVYNYNKEKNIIEKLDSNSLPDLKKWDPKTVKKAFLALQRTIPALDLSCTNLKGRVEELADYPAKEKKQ